MRPDDLPLLMALALSPRWANRNVNEFCDQIFAKGINPGDFFTLSESEWFERFNLPSETIHVLSDVRERANHFQSLAVTLQLSGCEACAAYEQAYPARLRTHFGIKSPPLLYIRGTCNRLAVPGVGIVGRTNASLISVQYAIATATETVRSGRPVVGGIDKDIDRAVMDRVFAMKGMYLGVLSEGILNVESEYLDKAMAEGHLSLVSIMHPRAMTSPVRSASIHPLIYALSEKVCIAETAGFGRTWEGAIEGLRNGLPVYVRRPAADENNANALLIEKGGVPEDFIPPKPELSTRETPVIEDPDQLDWFSGDSSLAGRLQHSTKLLDRDEQPSLFDVLED